MKPAEHDPALEALLEYLKLQRGFDVRGYKRVSLTRRIRRRMTALRASSFPDYQNHLESDPEEFNRLFNTILINVTSFFRDAPIWEFLAEAAIPALLAAKAPDEPVRVWTAGCASGEEAYSVAILLAEALGPDRFRRQVKIYATDLDEQALVKARQALYTPREAAGMPETLRSRYFQLQNEHFVFDKELRRALIFGRHNLLVDAPISRIDLLVCRNTLMYFNSDTQKQVLNRFHFALNELGYLFLGKAETLLSHAGHFTPVDLKHRIFMKARESVPRGRLLLAAPAGTKTAVDPMADDVQLVQLRNQAFDQSPLAQIVIDAAGTLAAANDRARQLFRLRAQDLGRPLQDLELSYRPVELRSGLEQAYQEGQVVQWGPVDWPSSPLGAIVLNVRITALRQASGALLGGCISFDDITRARQLEQELKHAHEELETAYEELQSTNEELETTNEELQSSVEELETTNEELQSTNEELETMNEELQSTNEELQTVNDELRRRSSELDQTNHVLGAILSGLPRAVVVLDRELRVLIWSSQAYELWGLREEEARDQFFLSLDIGLPVDQLGSLLRTGIRRGEESEVVVEAINRRGRAFPCRVTCRPLAFSGKEPEGIILMMDESA